MTGQRFTLLYRPRGSRDPVSGEMSLLRSLVPFELDPVRDIPNYHGQSHRGGWYASSKVGAMVRYESELERLRMQFLDFTPEVTSFAAQPFALQWVDGGKTYRYVPDLLIVRAAQARVVEDVKPARFHGSPRLKRAFDAAREALAPVDVTFNLWDKPQPTVVRNVQYLAGYRRPPAGLREYLGPILAALRERSHGLTELATRVGLPPLVLPVIYHLIWNHRIALDLSQPLSRNALLSPSSGHGQVA